MSAPGRRKRAAVRLEAPAVTLARILDALRRDPMQPAPPVALGTADFDWLVKLLTKIAAGESVNAAFEPKRRGRPSRDDRSLFVALDVELRRPDHAKIDLARAAVAPDWKLTTDQVKRAELKARASVASIMTQTDHATLRALVRMHRQRYLVR